MKRIIIIGSGGAGKSTLASEMSKMLNLPVIHLDSIFWKPNWEKTPDDEFDQTLISLMKKDKWIMDGNYSRTMEMRIKYADTIIFMNFNRYICMWRAFLRTYFMERVDEIKGCKEQMDRGFVEWIWTYPEVRTPKMLKLLDKYKYSKNVIIIRNSKEKAKFLKGVCNKTTI